MPQDKTAQVKYNLIKYMCVILRFHLKERDF